ncbi:hypothetical protein JQR84_23400 (plasmid) [Pseudomonas luteola]|uniref:hypothetical protein n=1 Tax=Pseudomonas TaxID=286 RepID=UPI003DA0FF36
MEAAGQRGQFAVNGGASYTAPFQIAPLGKNVRSCGKAKVIGAGSPDKRREVLQVVPVSAAGALVVSVGKPLDSVQYHRRQPPLLSPPAAANGLDIALEATRLAAASKLFR